MDSGPQDSTSLVIVWSQGIIVFEMKTRSHLQAGSIGCGGWLEVVTVVRAVRRVRSAEVGKAGEEQLGGEVLEGEALLLLATRDVAPVGRWCKGGVGAGMEVEVGEILEPGIDDVDVPGERHDAVHQWRNPHQQGDGHLPGPKLTKLHKAVIVIHNLSHKWWN